MAPQAKTAVAALLSASLYLSSPASAQVTDMVLMGFGEDENGTVHTLHLDSVRPAPYPSELDLRQAWATQDHSNDRTALHFRSHILSYYHCTRRMTAVAAVIEYDQSGNELSSVVLPAPQFRVPVSDSIEMRIFEQVCRIEV